VSADYSISDEKIKYLSFNAQQGTVNNCEANQAVDIRSIEKKLCKRFPFASNLIKNGA